MDLLDCLTARTGFIRQFYEKASKPFLEIIRKIEAAEEPYRPRYEDECGEPPFLMEWIDAKAGLQVLGASCISMLLSSLHLYFETWKKELNIDEDIISKCNKKGMIPINKCVFGQLMNTDWNDCPADLEMIEEITMARNCYQHPKDIVDERPKFDSNFMKKFPNPVFANVIEMKAFKDGLFFDIHRMGPGVSLDVTGERLLIAIDNTLILAKWMEERLLNIKYR